MNLMSKTTVITSLLLACGIGEAKPPSSEKPNIIMIAIDDLNDWTGAYGGHPQAKTPHLDTFAEHAMVFRNASCPGPVCGPSRSALLSGFMPATSGVYLNNHNMLDSRLVQTHATLPEYFSKHGYLTISKGKIFHKQTTSNGVDHGHWSFDVWEKETDRGKPDETKLYSRNKGIINGEKITNPKYTQGWGSDFAFGPLVGGNEGTMDYETAKWFEKKLREKYDKPFFMSVGISKPHLPFHVPQPYFDLYDLSTLQVPEYRLDDLDDIVNGNGKKVYSPSDDFLWCQEYGVMKEAVQAYLASVSYADACVGVVLDALAESDYADNTIILIWGDHGWHLGEKLRFRKSTLWRESTRLPLMVRLPGMNERQECTRNVNLIDLYPTLIDLCGLPEKTLDGRSFRALLENPKREWTPTVTTMGRGSHAVQSEKWHYITYDHGGEELYDQESDPMQWNNLAVSAPEKARPVIATLKPFLPKTEAPEILGSTKEKLAKNTDETIKPRRDLSKLK